MNENCEIRPIIRVREKERVLSNRMVKKLEIFTNLLTDSSFLPSL